MKILFVSLGCDKNLVDTEYMLGILGNEGYAFTDEDVYKRQHHGTDRGTCKTAL